MTISFVNSGANSTAGTGQAALTTSAIANTQAGDLAFVFYKYEGSSTTMTVSDSASNTWTGSTLTTKSSTLTNSNGTLHCGLHAIVLSTGATSHTFTATVGGAETRTYFSVDAVVFRTTGSGWTAVSSPLNSQGNTSGTQSIGNLSPSGNYAAFAGIGAYFDSTSITAGSGWTLASGGAHWQGEQRLSNSGGATIACDFGNFQTGDEWVGAAAAYTETGGGTTRDQEGFQFGADDGSESAHTFYGTQDSNVTRQTGENVLLRALVNATGDPASTAYTLRYQKNGSGGYAAVPVGASGTTTPSQPTSGTATTIGTAADPWTINRATASTGDMVVFIIGWDDSTTVSTVTPPAGPNGETAVSIAGPVASASTEIRVQAWYYIATGTWSSGTLSFDPSASETCQAVSFAIPAAQFKSSDPIGWANTAASAGTAESTLNSPTGTAESDDGGGRLFIAYCSDADAITAPASGTTTVNNTTGGGVGLCIVSRNTVVSNSESIAAITATIASDSWATVAFVVKPAATTNELYVATSGNITAGGAATTARLTAPSGKTTSDFVTGRRWDDENGTDSIDITTDDYTEVEWCLRAQSVADGTYFDFRVYAGTSALDTYGVTPRWTIGTPSVPSSTPRGYRAPAFQLAALMGF